MSSKITAIVNFLLGIPVLLYNVLAFPFAFVANLYSNTSTRFPRPNERGGDVWYNATSRHNIMVLLKLKFREGENQEVSISEVTGESLIDDSDRGKRTSQKISETDDSPKKDRKIGNKKNEKKEKKPKVHDEIVVATYHMPCMYYLPKVMVIHAALCAQYVQNYANGCPAILTGDFNIKPDSTPYKIITEGEVDPKSVDDYPEPAFIGDTWSPKLRTKFKSAYKVVEGKEPKLTNYNWAGDSPVRFEGTLDYIFYIGKGLKATNVRSLDRDIKKCMEVESLPSLDLPSDHLLLAADFTLD